MKNPLNSSTLSRQGIVLVNKPVGHTSHDTVQQARKIFQTRKIGHSGTLDPFSQGLLLLLVGEAVSLQQYFTARSKVYRARFKFATTTDSLDPTGNVTESHPDFVMPSRQTIQEKIDTQFIGEISQTPPIFSAIKVQGKRAYSLARKGEEFSLPERRVKINGFDILSVFDREIDVRIACSSGTYIRSLAKDLAKELGTVGMVESLVRERIGNYDLEDAIDLESWGQNREGEDISFTEIHKNFPGIIPMNTLINKESFLKGIQINCSLEEFFKAKNGNFSFSLLKRQDGVFHLTYKDTVLMIVEKRFGKTRVLFNQLKYIHFGDL